MKRGTARSIHSITNFAFWVENPDWHTGNPVGDIALKAVRTLPINAHKTLKKTFYDTDKALAVNGETVVVPNGTDKVDKFMFRYLAKWP